MPYYVGMDAKIVDNATISGKAIRYFYYFAIAGFIGFVYEYLLITFYYHEVFVNQGPLHGPFLLIYAAGGLLLILLLQGLTAKRLELLRLNVMPAIVAVAIAVITAVLEYSAHLIIELTQGVKMWDYSDKPFNLNGRICVEDTARFVVLGLLELYVIVPLMGKFFKRVPARANLLTALAVVLIFVVDIIYSIVG